MGILDRLIQGGSPYSLDNGNTPPINPLATQQSKMHADGTAPGYSIDGDFFGDVNDAYQMYRDGLSNPLPQPSQLDMGAATPPRYLDNLPG